MNTSTSRVCYRQGKNKVSEQFLTFMNSCFYYWIWTAPTWIVWSYLIINVTGANFMVTRESSFSMSCMIIWIFGTGVILNPLYKLVLGDKSNSYLEKEQFLILLMPVLFLMGLLIPNKLYLGFIVIGTCLVYIVTRYILIFSTMYKPGLNLNTKQQLFLNILLLFQLGITLLPMVPGSMVSWSSILVHIIQLVIFIVLLVGIGVSSRGVTVVIIACYASVPYMHVVVQPGWVKEWIGALFIFLGVYNMFFRKGMENDNKILRDGLTLVLVVLSIFTSYRHVPLLLFLLLYMVIPGKWKQLRWNSSWIIYIISLPIIVSWLVAVMGVFGIISRIPLVLPILDLPYISVPYKILFANNGVYVLAPAWILGLLGIKRMENILRSVGKIISWNIVYLSGCYAAIKYPSSGGVIYFLPFLLVTMAFYVETSHVKKSWKTLFLEKIVVFATVMVSMLYIMVKLLQSTIIGSMFFSLIKPSFLFKLMKEILLYPGSGLSDHGSWLAASYFIVILILTFIPDKWKLPKTGRWERYYSFLKHPCCHIPLITLMVMVVSFHNWGKNTFNILEHAQLLTTSEPCLEKKFHEPQKIQHLLVISYASHSVLLKQGTRIASLRLSKGGEIVDTFPVRIGLETAEWAAERPDLKNLLQHEPVSAWNQFIEIQDNEPFIRNIYKWETTLPGPLVIDNISICLDSKIGSQTQTNLTIENILIW